jgi:hypothetical protein
MGILCSKSKCGATLQADALVVTVLHSIVGKHGWAVVGMAAVHDLPPPPSPPHTAASPARAAEGTPGAPPAACLPAALLRGCFRCNCCCSFCHSLSCCCLARWYRRHSCSPAILCPVTSTTKPHSMSALTPPPIQAGHLAPSMCSPMASRHSLVASTALPFSDCGLPCSASRSAMRCTSGATASSASRHAAPAPAPASQHAIIHPACTTLMRMNHHVRAQLLHTYP